jgi:predicted metal-dependent phosphoesterase TrpH
MLKASLHVHVMGDQDDYILYTGFELLDKAAELGYEVIAFTSHERVIFSPELKNHAENLGILLIPGIEINLDGHTLIINACPKAQTLKTLDDLRNYRKERPEIFTIAAHPFYPKRKYCFQESLVPNLDAFDAIEHSWFYSKLMDWNPKARAVANKHNLPYIATSDIHLLEQLHNGHVLIDAEKNVKSILEALRAQRFTSVAKPQGVFQMWRVFGKMLATGLLRYAPWTDPHLVFEHETLPPKHQETSSDESPEDRFFRRLRPKNSHHKTLLTSPPSQPSKPKI